MKGRHQYVREEASRVASREWANVLRATGKHYVPSSEHCTHAGCGTPKVKVKTTKHYIKI